MSALSVPAPHMINLSPPAAAALAVSSDEGHGDMMTTSSELAELCQEPLTDLGLARISRLVTQMETALTQTVAARQTEGHRAVA